MINHQSWRKYTQIQCEGEYAVHINGRFQGTVKIYKDGEKWRIGVTNTDISTLPRHWYYGPIPEPTEDNCP